MGTTRGNPLDGLDEAWDAYRTLCRAKLIERRGHSPLSASAATGAIRGASDTWGDPHTPCGAWLARLRAADHHAADQVLEAVRSFSFDAVPHAPAHPTSGEVAAVTLGGAFALGAVSATLLELLGMVASITSTLLAAIVGALLTWSVASGARSQALTRASGELLHAYLEQLDGLRKRVTDIAAAV